MNQERYQQEIRRRRRRSLKATIAIALWAGGCALLYELWDVAQGIPPPAGDLLGTVVYLVTFFYIFALWPIHVAVDRMIGRVEPLGSETKSGQ